MKTILLSLSVLAMVSTSFAIPPKNYKSKRLNSPKVSQRAVGSGQKGKSPSKNSGIQARNEGYTPGITVPDKP